MPDPQTPRPTQVEHLRTGITPPVLAILGAVTVAAAWWFFHTLAQAYYPEMGFVGAILILAAGAGILWWAGTFDYLASVKNISYFERIPVPRGLLEDPNRGEAFVEEYQRASRQRINDLVEQLIYDYGVLLSGGQPDMEYASPQVIAVFRQAVAPVLRRGDTIRPDFGNHVNIDISWNTGDVRVPVTATAVFTDQSTMVPRDGMPVRLPVRRVTVTAAFNHQFTQIVDATLGGA